MAAQYPDSNKWFTTAAVTPQLEYQVGKTRPVLEVLFGAVALVLLIACVNVAGLLLVRSSRRSGEIALRGALGASRSEIVWQLLTESVVLSLISGIAGIAMASGVLKELAVLFPQALPRLRDVSIDLPVLAFALGVSVLTGHPVRRGAGAAHLTTRSGAGIARRHAYGDERTRASPVADVAGDCGDGVGIGAAGGGGTADSQLRQCAASRPGL